MKKHRSGRGILFAAVLLLTLYKAADVSVAAQHGNTILAGINQTLAGAIGTAR